MSLVGMGRGRGRGQSYALNESKESIYSKKNVDLEMTSLSESTEIKSIFRSTDDQSSFSETFTTERFRRCAPPRIMPTAPRGNIFPGFNSEFSAMRLTGSSSGRSTARTPSFTTTTEIKHQIQPKRGTAGDPINIVANYIKLFTKGFSELFEYHVRFSPDVVKKSFRREIISQHKNILKDIAFDGATIHSFHDLGDKIHLIGHLPSTSEKVNIFIQKVGRNSTDSPKFFQIANLIFRKLLELCDMKLIGRNFYQFDKKIDLDRFNLTVFPGILTGVNFYEDCLMINVDRTMKILNRTTVYQRLTEIFNEYQNVTEAQARAIEELVGQMIITTYSSSTYKIYDIAWKQRPTDSFICQNGSKVTFVEYYQNKYQVKIKDLDQPLLISRISKKNRKSEVNNQILLIPEICCLTGVSSMMKNDMQFMKQMILHTRVCAPMRYEQINNTLNAIHHNDQCKTELDKWNLELDTDLVKLEARLLENERIFYRESSILFNYNNSEWSRDSRDLKHVRSANLANWVFIFPSKDEQAAIILLDGLLKVCSSFGMHVEYPNIVQISDGQPSSYLRGLNGLLGKNVNFVFCILPNTRKDRYDELKRFFCVTKPILSQMVSLKTITNRNQIFSIATKIGIQLNAKLGGEIWTVQIPTKTLMVVGIDMYHDPKGKYSPIGAFVASTNSTLTRYYSRVIHRKTSEDFVNSLSVCMEGALQEYRKNNGCHPGKVIIYRDGIKNGQISTTIEKELPQVISTLSKLMPDGKTKFAMIIVKKRGNARFFLKDGRSLTNPPPGTVIDHTVTRADAYDFYLISQCARQGTAAPTHYDIIWDQTSFKVDHMQRLAFKLCHLYYNWPGTIRVPAVCQYANKLASLVSQHLHEDFDLSLADKLFYL